MKMGLRNSSVLLAGKRGLSRAPMLVCCLAAACLTCIALGPNGQDHRPPRALLRLRTHYASLNTSALSYQLSWISGSTTRQFGPHRFYFSRPDVIKESILNGPVERTSLRQRARVPEDAIVDPGISPQVVLPHLFLGFEVAEYFDKVESSGRELVRGIGTDVIVMSKQLRLDRSNHQTPRDTGVLQLRLWIDDAGRLRRYESTIRFGSALPASTRRGELLVEEDNRGLPNGFFAKRKS